MEMQAVRYYNSSLWVQNTYYAWQLEESNKSLLLECPDQVVQYDLASDEEFEAIGFTPTDDYVDLYTVLEQAESLGITLWTKLEIKDLM